MAKCVQDVKRERLITIEFTEAELYALILAHSHTPYAELTKRDEEYDYSHKLHSSGDDIRLANALQKILGVTM